MKIYEFCPYYNEAVVTNIKIEENSGWVDELHLVEANRTFRFDPKPYHFSPNHPAPENKTGANSTVVYHKLDGDRLFRGKTHWGPSHFFPYFRKKDSARTNEMIQRNHVHQVLHPDDDDIVILSDIDEIIDSRHADYVVDMARRHGIITVRLHHTLFFLNLYSQNWHEIWDGGNAPRDYSYRTFVMTGRHFNALPYKSDRLRRKGEANKLASSITCLPEITGFHHSWLGDAASIAGKIKAYSHSLSDHSADIIDANTGEISTDKIRDLVRGRKSIFAGHQLEIRPPDDPPMLGAITRNMAEYSKFMI